jgi:hypothetical protein
MPQQQTQQGNQRTKMNNGGNGAATKPAHTVRYGAIKAAIWRNLVDNGNASRPMYNVTLTRSYREGEEWKDSTSFGLDDLLVLSKIANDCHTWIHEQRSRDTADPV